MKELTGTNQLYYTGKSIKIQVANQSIINSAYYVKKHLGDAKMCTVAHILKEFVILKVIHEFR